MSWILDAALDAIWAKMCGFLKEKDFFAKTP